ncbi:MAG: hypothetical protein GF364_01380, partial [Candidatus Lokiarchaeota archaeon]|nr:hypothetical protein [Candidatus Lokiarchaeota archaeon]
MPSKFNLNTPSFKKQMISLIVVSGLLVGGWYSISYISALIFQSNKYDKQNTLDDPNYGDYDNIPVVPQQPGLTIGDINITDIDFDMSNFDPETLESLLGLLEGNTELMNELLENLDPEELNYPVFRVFPKGSSSVDELDVWRMTGCDQYSGVGSQWTHSSSSSSGLTLEPNVDLYDESFTIYYPFGSSTEASMQVPTCFYKPHIEDGTVNAPNLQSYIMQEDMDEGIISTLTIDPATGGNLTYDLGKEAYDPFTEFNDDSGTPAQAQSEVSSSYLQMPEGGLSGYRSANPNFDAHFGYIQGNISGATTVYEIADGIREYLADNFDLDLDTETGFTRPSSSEDQVEWFLERGSGLPMDFASAYVMFLRGFGVPCRYAHGYNSIAGKDMGSYYIVTLGCMYAWAEVYYPDYDDFGPMLILHNGLLGGMIVDTENFEQEGTINVRVNGTYSEYAIGGRYNEYDLTYELNMTTGESNASRTLELYDHAEEVSLGTVVTDSNGYAHYTLKFDDDFTAGVHPISVKQSLFLQNMTASILISQMDVELISVNPTVVDLNPTLTLNSTNVRARFTDPHNGNPIKKAVLHPVVVDGGAAISGSTSPSGVKVDATGTIDTTIEISDVVNPGSYDFRVDYNGSYIFENPLTGDPEPFELPPPYNLYGFSSDTVPFDVSNSDDVVFNLFVNDAPRGDTIYTTRAQDLKIDVYLAREGTPVSGEDVEIYLAEQPSTPIATLTTDGTGSDQLYFDIPVSNPWFAGPHSLYGKWVLEDRTNSSWWVVVNETVSISSFCSESAINRQGNPPTTFDVYGQLQDSVLGTEVPYGQVAISMWQVITDKSSLLEPYPAITESDSNGDYTINLNVDDESPLGSYSIYATFTGTFQVDGETSFDLPNLLANSGPHALDIEDPDDVNLIFLIDGTPTQPDYLSGAPSKTRSSTVQLQVWLYVSGSPAVNELVVFRDETTGVQLFQDYTDGSGYVSYSPSLANSNFAAGL